MLENLEGAGLVNGEVLTIEVWHLIKNEPHHIWCINRILHLVYRPMQLTLDEIHHIYLKTLAINSGLKHRMGMSKEVDKPSTNSIQIPGLGCNVAPKHTKEDTESGKETRA